MSNEAITPSRLNKPGHLWYDDRPFAEALTGAINAFWIKYNGAMPVSVYCGDPIPAGFEGDGVPVWHQDAVGVHCFWLEWPEGMDGRGR